jgi:nucleotide-binding universal stress UspA family protein
MNILVAVDSIEFNKAIADFVLKHHWQPDSVFKIIHIIEQRNDVTGVSFIPFLDSIVTNERREAESLTADLASRIFSGDLTVELTTEVLEGQPCERIAETARQWQADLIIVGSHGRRGITRFTLGSVSSAVVALAPCSVLVVRLPSSQETASTGKAVLAATK